MPKTSTSYPKGKSGNPKGGNIPSAQPTDDLRVLRWVRNNPTAETDDLYAKGLQEVARKDPLKFHAMWKAAEKDFTDRRMAKASEKEPGNGAPDEGTDRIEELIESILSRAEQEST